MRMIQSVFTCSVLLFTDMCYPALAAPPVEPAALSSARESERTQVLILASPHLRELGADFNRNAVDPLVTRLASFAPDAVAVEAMPPTVIRSMVARGGVNAQIAERFASKTLRLGKQAREALSLSYEEAAARVTAAVQGANEGQPYDHRALAMLFLAVNDLPSAALQWAYLDEGQRKGGDDVPAEITDFLSERLNNPNEIYLVAVPLAKRLGHVRLTGIDDHSDKDLYVTIMDELDAEIRKNPLLSKVTAAEIYKEGPKILAESNRMGDLTAAYRFFNSPDYARRDIQAQWDVFIRTRMESGIDRTRLALWDVRNLLIAAHIRRLTAKHPGKRVLVIIGASHKAFLEAYLRQAMDIRLVPAEVILEKGP